MASCVPGGSGVRGDGGNKILLNGAQVEVRGELGRGQTSKSSSQGHAGQGRKMGCDLKATGFVLHH